MENESDSFDERWLKEVREFALDHRKGTPIPNGHDLGPLDNFKRRATGGVLLQFLDFLQGGEALEIFATALEKFPLHSRAFLFITDLPGAVAGQELMQADSDRAFCILKDEWRAWLSDDAHEDDALFLEHFEFWSVWHQDIHPEWEFESDIKLDAAAEQGVEYWVHEEGFALAPNAGRGAQHLWKWNGEQMEKVEEAITSWTSIPGMD
jgi:hypothetical protein